MSDDFCSAVNFSNPHFFLLTNTIFFSLIAVAMWETRRVFINLIVLKKFKMETATSSATLVALSRYEGINNLFFNCSPHIKM